MTSQVPYSVPRAQPFYGPPPYAYRGCPQLIVLFRSSEEAIRELVPEPMVPNADDLAFLMIGSMVTDEFGTYDEAILAVPASAGGVQGNHVVFHFVSTDKPMAAGREIMGWPKKLAELDWRAEGDAVTASCTRDGQPLIRARGEMDGSIDPSALPLSPTWLNLKVIPSVLPDAPPDVAQLTGVTLTDLKVEEARGGRASLELSSTATDPVSRLEVHEVVGAVVCRLSFDLPAGFVAHDYLGAGALAPALTGVGDAS